MFLSRVLGASGPTLQDQQDPYPRRNTYILSDVIINLILGRFWIHALGVFDPIEARTDKKGRPRFVFPWRSVISPALGVGGPVFKPQNGPKLVAFVLENIHG